MEETRYMISDAAKKVEVEAHVLRYWEEELELPIARNEMGHRYYTEENIRIFQSIKELKERGFQLKAIKVLLPEIIKKGQKSADHSEEKQEHTTSVVMQFPNNPAPSENISQFQAIMDQILAHALEKNNKELVQMVSKNVEREMTYLMKLKEEREEERYRQLDAAIRAHQKGRGLAAATKEEIPKKKFLLFRRKKKSAI